jgi:methylenetetrahydrofolate dehydrogenase (NADP+)/methenyltetrahydrofolate cyclohydrolase
MTAQLIDGNALSRQLRAEVAQRATALKARGTTPGLAVVLARVEALNNDPSIHGILVQLPLPAHIDDHKVIETISPLKDVDGFHVASAGALMVGEVGFKACTPYGCMKMLESIGMKDLRGKHAVVIGRSNIVGHDAAGRQCHRHHLPQRHGRSGRHDTPGRHRGGRRGQAQRADRRHVQARCRGHRRGHEPQ